MNNSALILSQGTLQVMAGINDAKKQLGYMDSQKQNVNNSYTNIGSNPMTKEQSKFATSKSSFSTAMNNFNM